jgi:hypothetical protein
VKTIRLGDETPTGNTFYLQVEGDPAVYTVWMNHGQHFHWRSADLRSKALLTTINAEEVTYYKARLRSGQTIEAIEKTAAESKQFQLGFGKFLMVKPYPAAHGVDAEKFQPMLDGIASIAIAEFVDDTPTDLAAYGLARPWGELLVRDKAGTLHLLFGANRGSDKVCFRIAGEPAVYAVDSYKLEFMSTKAFDLVDRFLFIPSIDDVDRLEVTAGGATHVFTLARATKKASETDAQGAAEEGAEDEVVVTYTGDGTELNEDWFKKFYQSVIALSAEGEVTRAVANAPVVKVRYVLNTGDRRDINVGLAPYDKIFYASFVDGIGGFALTKVQVDAMLAKMAKLLAGEEVTD